MGNVSEGIGKIMFGKKKNTMGGTKNQNSDLVYKMAIINDIFWKRNLMFTLCITRIIMVIFNNCHIKMVKKGKKKKRKKEEDENRK